MMKIVSLLCLLAGASALTIENTLSPAIGDFKVAALTLLQIILRLFDELMVQ